MVIDASASNSATLLVQLKELSVNFDILRSARSCFCVNDLNGW